MFCYKCGNQMTDGAKFCPKCGANQEDTMGKQLDNDNTVASQNKKINNKSGNKAIAGIIGLLVVLVMMVVALIVIILLKKKISGVDNDIPISEEITNNSDSDISEIVENSVDEVLEEDEENKAAINEPQEYILWVVSEYIIESSDPDRLKEKYTYNYSESAKWPNGLPYTYTYLEVSESEGWKGTTTWGFNNWKGITADHLIDVDELNCCENIYGNLDSIISADGDGYSGEGNTYYSKEYDAAGRIILVKKEGNDTITWKYTYDDLGRVIQLDYSAMDYWGNGNDSKYEYEYDEQGNITKEIYTLLKLYAYGEEERNEVCTIEYLYDDNGHLCEYKTCAEDGTEYDDVWENKYDSLGRLIEYKKIDKIKDTIYEWKTYEYDTFNNVISYCEKYDDGTTAYTEDCLYEYDEENNIVKISNDYYTYERFYDENGNCIKINTYDSGCLEKTEYFEYVGYFIDKDGNSTKIEQYN